MLDAHMCMPYTCLQSAFTLGENITTVNWLVLLHVGCTGAVWRYTVSTGESAHDNCRLLAAVERRSAPTTS
jgi:hypothetical protein